MFLANLLSLVRYNQVQSALTCEQEEKLLHNQVQGGMI